MPVMSKRRIAYAVTRYVYRDTDYLETMHSEGRRFDLTSYLIMHSQVTERLLEIIPYIKYMRMSLRELNTVAPQLSDAGNRFLIRHYRVAKSVSEWYPAKKLNLTVGNDLAAYLLDGRFRQACENGESSTDSVFKELNIDVHNRVFTLMENGIIR